MSQASPNLSQHRPAGPHEPPMPSHSVPPSQGQGFGMPAQATPGQALGGHTNFEREREARERDIREREFEEQARREHEMRERELRERQQREQAAQHQDQLQLHQPVAVGPRMQSAIHGPNGLLSSGGPPTAPQPPPAAQNGAMALFGPHFDGAQRAQQPGQMQPQSLLFGAAPGMGQMPPAPLAPGQQPILNVSICILFPFQRILTFCRTRSVTSTKSRCSSQVNRQYTTNF